ncbi:glycosyltransferase [Bacteroides heparinolyticus]|uniref:glycosyltransferase n=1 Tax=Prevotella heparinolytica TaxID=28113 RepID=UPI0035A07D41
MSNIPRISVIVPVYKVEKHLSQCVESILVQTFTDFELLLIDDGSPDNCGEICEEYARKDKRIRVFHQENAGLSCARNTGLVNAYGRYVTFVDSDDYVKINYLKDLYDSLPSDKTLMGVIAGSLERCLPNKEFQTLHVPEKEITSEKVFLILTDLIDKYVTYAGNKLYDNRIIKQHKISFIPFVSGLEDMLFLLDYLLYADFMFIRDYNNYIYRVGYSTDALSVRINSFHAEYAAFSNYLKRVYTYQKKFDLEDDSLNKAWRSLTVFFHKVILGIYKAENNYTRRERIAFLRRVLLSDKEWIKKHFLPQYKADVLGKFLLCNISISVFDVWMLFLSGIKFKKRFGEK